ncbi:MAG TPA: M15 family metallopeptidase [Candidatus Eisenbacteria bacterium]|jgi:hypothetical protein
MSLTDAQVIGTFGDPGPFVRQDGSIDERWPTMILAPLTLPAPLPLSWDHQHTVTRLRVHRKLVGLFSAALAAIHANAEAWASLGDTGGAYAWRPQRGAKRLSRHCWAIALDLDVGDNPIGGKPHMHPAVIAAFAAQGFEWGGAWKRRKDPMHFEFADLGRLAIPAGGSGPVA